MSQDLKITTFRGKPIEAMTRDELIAALNWFAEQYQYLTSPPAIHARALGQVEMMKRGER